MIAKMNETNSSLNGFSNINSIQNNTNIGNKRFLLVSEDSVKSIADQNGFDNLNEDVIRLLSSDVSYRMRHLVHNSIQLMRQSKRRRLTTQDINQALETSDCEKLFGFEANDEPIQQSYVKDAKVFVADDTVVDLNQEINKIFDRSDGQMNLFEDDIRLNIALDINERQGLNENFIKTEDFCEELKQFYQNIVKAILGSNNQLFLIAMRDLSNNRRISKILSYLISFIRNGIRRLSHDICQLKRFLQTIQCLMRNPSLHLATEPFQSVLVQSILDCIIEPLNPMSDHWTLRDSASLLLVNVLNEWFSPLESHQIQNQTYDSLRKCLLDFSKPLSSHYGVIKTFQSLGYDMIVQYLYPTLSVYFTHLLPIIDSNSMTDLQIRADGLRVFNELLFIAELICLKSRSLIINDLDLKLDFKDYNQLADIFGDSLYAKLPISFDKFRHKFYCEDNNNVSQQKISLFETIDSQKTGEELLDAFYEAPTHTEDLKSEVSANLEDDNSGEDNSVISDNERETTATDLLQIKSSISDPTLGIKLTFKKLKREHSHQQMDSKRRINKKSFQKSSLIAEPVFENICLKETSIRFDYGNTRLNHPIISKTIDIPEPTKWFMLTMTDGRTHSFPTKLKTHKMGKNSNLFSCDLFNVI